MLMSEQNETQTNTSELSAEASITVPMIIYVLYLSSLIFGITGIIGVIMAYINKGDGNYLDSHYQYQIRTFWIGLLYSIIGAILTYVFIGFLVLLLVFIWFVIRCVRGIRFLSKNQPIPEPTTWMV
jgi:uncharacterized membrane protein